MEYRSKIFPNLRAEIIDLLRKQYPDIYEKINLEQSSLLAFLVNLQTWLTETELLYLGTALKESLLATSQQPESILWHAYSVGYKPQFAIPATGTVEFIIPTKNLQTNERILTNYHFVLTRDEELYGTSLYADDVVPFRLQYDYEIIFTGTTGIVYEKEDDENKWTVNYRLLNYTIAGVTYECVAVPLKVIQIRDIVEFSEIVPAYNATQFPTIQIPLTLENFKNVAQIEVYIDNEEAVYQPVVFLFPSDKYGFAIRFGETPSLVLSNGVFGKKVIPGSTANGKIIITDGARGSIRENSLLFRQNPVNKITNQSLPYYAFIHPVIANGYYTEDFNDIRLNALRTLRTNERLVTAQDYRDLIERDFKNIYALAYSRQTDFNINEVSIYLGVVKSRDDERAQIDFFKTDTKAIIIEDRQLNPQPGDENEPWNVLYQSGSYYLLPSAVILQEDLNVHNSGHFVRAVDKLDINNLPTDCEGLWFPLFTYEINPVDNTVRVIFNPVQYAYQTTLHKEEAVYQGIFIRTSVSPYTVTLDPQTFQYKVQFTITFTFSGNTSNFNLLTSANVDDWLFVRAHDTIHGLTIDLNSGTFFPSVNIGQNEITVLCEFTLPYTALQEDAYNFLTQVFFKLPTESTFNVQIAESSTPGVFFKFDFTPLTNPKMTHITTDTCNNVYNFRSDDVYVIYDVPVLSLYELWESTPEVLSRQFYDLFRDISKYAKERAILGVENICLLARTFGFSYLYKYLTNSINPLLLPLNIEANLTVDPSADVSSITQTIRDNIRAEINNNVDFFAILSKLKLLTAINKVPQVLTAEILMPEQDVIFKIPSINTLPKCVFRALTPEIYFVKDSGIQLSVATP